MVWCQAGHKPLAKIMMAKISDAKWVYPDISGKLGQHHGCQCPGSYHPQVIISHGIAGTEINFIDMEQFFVLSRKI